MHIVRDGRDVVCSLLEKPWLRRGEEAGDDAGIPYGSYARFWVEPERRAEFESASDARRAAWVWRSYVTAARSAGAVASSCATRSWPQIRTGPRRRLARQPRHAAPGRSPLRLRAAHGSSVGRYRA